MFGVRRAAGEPGAADAFPGECLEDGLKNGRLGAIIRATSISGRNGIASDIGVCE